MSVHHRLAALALAALFAGPVAAHASDDNPTAPYSRAPTRLNLCKGDDAPFNAESCKEDGYDKIAGEIDRALQTALAKAPANIRPFLKRDQGFFNERTSPDHPANDQDPPAGRDASPRRQRQGLGKLG